MSRDLKNTRQPLNTFFAQGVLPFQKSPIILSGGHDTPYYYSLGNQSTIPFVRLQGSGGTQKEFTWGESIEVLPGQNVQVQSASYMHGDIQIQSGIDSFNRPRRITIPVPVTSSLPVNDSLDTPPSSLITPLFPCDARQARGAWLGLSIGTADPGSIPELNIVGLNQQHSWLADVPAFFTNVAPPGKKYTASITFQAGTVYTTIGLGFGWQNAPKEAPMHLADYVTWSIQNAPQSSPAPDVRLLFFYTLEY